MTMAGGIASTIRDGRPVADGDGDAAAEGAELGDTIARVTEGDGGAVLSVGEILGSTGVALLDSLSGRVVELTETLVDALSGS